MHSIVSIVFIFVDVLKGEGGEWGVKFLSFHAVELESPWARPVHEGIQELGGSENPICLGSYILLPVLVDPPPPFLFPSSSPALQLNYLNILGSVSLQLTGELKWDIKTILERFVLINDNSFQTEICFTRIDNSLHLFFL